MPFAVAASSVPILAFAPIFNNWFGLDQQLSKAMVAAVLCFFPIMINTVRGLTTVDARAIELFRSLRRLGAAGLPEAAGPELAAVCLHVAAARGHARHDRGGGRRILRRARPSLGQYIATYSAFLNFERSWAAIVFACIIGIGLYLVVACRARRDAVVRASGGAAVAQPPLRHPVR